MKYVLLLSTAALLLLTMPAVSHPSPSSVMPDYWIKVDQIVSEGNVISLFGSAGGMFVPQAGTMKPEGETPVVWRALVKEGRVAEWRV
jgi:hypothetical protein